MNVSRRITASSLASLGIATIALACQSSKEQPPRVATAPNASWVSVSGTVASAGDDAFVLDYGTGAITVEMDDWDWYSEGRALLQDDEVTVYGFIDDDFYERRTLEASSVYVKDLNTHFYASGADEEEFRVAALAHHRPLVELTGKVTKVTGAEFTLSTGSRTVEVNTAHMPYNPLDDEGYQKVRQGDRVRVSGSLDTDFFEDLDFIAETVVSLHSDGHAKVDEGPS